MATVNLKSFPATEEATCPHCHKPVVLYDPAGSEYFACPRCHGFVHFTDHDTAVVQKHSPVPKQQPVLKLGSEGMLHGYAFKVIAYAEKKERDTHYAWREYILYNYEKGYANLAEFDGHWNFVAGKCFYPELEKLSDRTWDFVEYEGNEYRLFNKYTAVTTGISGEFDWDILADKPKVTEYIAPPCILIKENDAAGSHKADFYLGTYTNASEIATAFGTDVGQFPSTTGIGANQPSVHADRWFSVIRITPLLLLAVAAIALLCYNFKGSNQVLNQDFNLVADSTKVSEFKPFVTPSFHLYDRSSPLEFLIYSDVSNNWLEATIVLVNETTNQTWEVTEAVEYYYGYEDGENWSEGSHEAEVLLSAIPKGKYHLNVYPSSGDMKQVNVHINATVNPFLWRNFWVTFLLLGMYPFYCWLRMLNFEKNRWMNSDYSPYQTNE